MMIVLIENSFKYPLWSCVGSCGPPYSVQEPDHSHSDTVLCSHARTPIPPMPKSPAWSAYHLGPSLTHCSPVPSNGMHATLTHRKFKTVTTAGKSPAQLTPLFAPTVDSAKIDAVT